VGHFPPPVIWLPIAAFVGMSLSETRKAKRLRRALSALVVWLGMIALISCAGVSSGGGSSGGGQPPQPVTYHITVTGTSPGTPADAGQSTTVALVVN
jgi:hypothetical protein